MKAPVRPPAPHPNTAAQTVKTAIKSAQIRKDSFKPDRDAQVTQTVGMNPAPPAQRSASAEVDPAIPYSAGSPVSYAPFGYGMYPW